MNKIVIGNWKMNKNIMQSVECTRELLRDKYGLGGVRHTDIVLTPSFLALSEVKRCAGKERESGSGHRMYSMNSREITAAQSRLLCSRKCAAMRLPGIRSAGYISGTRMRS